MTQQDFQVKAKAAAKEFANKKKVKKTITKAMLRYSIPLIPNSALWWITDYSDRYMVTVMVSEAANGIYSLAYRLPNMLIMVCGIFMDAWQISAVTEEKERDKFYTKVMSMYSLFLFFMAATLPQLYWKNTLCFRGYGDILN